jgi:hypothetical protein
MCDINKIQKMAEINNQISDTIGSLNDLNDQLSDILFEILESECEDDEVENSEVKVPAPEVAIDPTPTPVPDPIPTPDPIPAPDPTPDPTPDATQN